jgi:transcription elongation factor SPT6
VQALEDKDVGEVIIRPSIKGPTHLSMTLKLSDGVYNNIDILEGGKESRDLTSFLSLGKTLTVDGETFEGLDEV